MTVKELYGILDKKIPPSLSCEWDNDGLMCCPDGARVVKRILITLDVTDGAVDRAISGDFDMIISHHPFFFKGLKSVRDDLPLSAAAIKLICEGVSVASFHTRLDAVEGGVNDTLAALLGLENTLPFGNEGEEIGRIGDLDGITLTELCDRVKAVTGAPFVLCADGGRSPLRVAVLGGEGGDDTEAARRAGADTFISGRLGYHNMTDAAGRGMSLIEAGHFYTEFPVCRTLERWLLAIEPNFEIEIYNSNCIEAI